MGFNRCSFQLLRSYKRHKENKSKRKVCPCTKALPQSGIHGWIKQGRRKRRKRVTETGKTEARRLMERKAAQQNKNLSETKTRLPKAQLRWTKLEEESLTSPQGCGVGVSGVACFQLESGVGFQSCWSRSRESVFKTAGVGFSKLL